MSWQKTSAPFGQSAEEDDMTRLRADAPHRDAQAHQSLDKREQVTPPTPVVQRSRQAALRRQLSSAETLRRAFLLMDVLGPPKALQEEPHERRQRR